MKKSEQKNTNNAAEQEQRINKRISSLKRNYLLWILLLGAVCLAASYVYILPQTDMQMRGIFAGAIIVPFLIIIFISSKVYKKKIEKYELEFKRIR